MIAVIVDTNNMYMTTKRRWQGGVPDYTNYLKYIEDNIGSFDVAIAYIDLSSPSAHTFADTLEYIGFEVHTKPPVRLHGCLITDWKVEITMEVIDAIEHDYRVVLGTNDRYFLPLIERYREDIEVFACSIPRIFTNFIRTHEISESLIRYKDDRYGATTTTK